MPGTTVQPAQPNGLVQCRGAKNSTNLLTVTQGIRDAVNTYLDGTAGTHTMYTVEVKVTKMQIAKPA